MHADTAQQIDRLNATRNAPEGWKAEGCHCGHRRDFHFPSGFSAGHGPCGACGCAQFLWTTPDQPNLDAALLALRNDPATYFWVRHTIERALEVDAVDAASALEVVAQMFATRAAALAQVVEAQVGTILPTNRPTRRG